MSFPTCLGIQGIKIWAKVFFSDCKSFCLVKKKKENKKQQQKTEVGKHWGKSCGVWYPNNISLALLVTYFPASVLIMHKIL